MRNFNVTVDGRTYQVQVEEVGASTAAPVSTPKSAPAAAPAPVLPKANVSGGTEVKSPMPGMLLDLKVANGAAVKAGDVIFVLEAMKMENEITAPVGGTITFVAAKGASLATGDVIAVIQ